VDSNEGAAVRIAMTVAVAGSVEGKLQKVIKEVETGELGKQISLSEKIGRIHADLKSGADAAGAKVLKANEGLSSRGVIPHGSGLIITEETAENLRLGKIIELEKHIRKYWNGKDFTSIPRGVFVIDLLGLSIEEVKAKFPEVYQHVLLHVKPHSLLTSTLAFYRIDISETEQYRPFLNFIFACPAKSVTCKN
jgi:hypothetical protein